MLTLTLNNQVIPLPTDFSMRLTWKSPVVDFEKIPSGYGLGMSFPINEYTRQLFGNPERFTKYRAGNDQKFPGFEVRFGGVLLMAGTLSITSSSKDAYEATLIDQVGVLGEKEQERSILEFPEFAEEMAFENKTAYSPDTDPYCLFPFANSNFFKDKGVMIERTVTIPDPDRPGKTKDETYELELMSYLYNKSVQSIINIKDNNGTTKLLESIISLRNLQQKNNTYDTGEVSVVTPMFYLNYIISKALKLNGYHLIENKLATDSVLKKLCIYNNYDITAMNFDQTGEIIGIEYKPEISGDLIWVDTNGNPISSDVKTSISIKLYSYIRWIEGLKVVPKNSLPKMKVGDLLLSTQNLVNICYHFLPNNTINAYSRDEILSGVAIDLNVFFLGTWAIGEKKNVALKFIREHDSNDLLFSEEFQDLSDRRDNILEPVENYSLLLLVANPKESDIRFVKSVNAFYEYKWITNSKTDSQTLDALFYDTFGWEKLSIGLQNGFYMYGRDEVEEIKSNWSSTWGINQGFGQMAIVRQQGNMNAWKSKTQAFSPRLLIQDADGSKGSNETTELSFEYEKPEIGLFPKFWKLWNPFWANRLPVTGDFDLPVNILRHLIYNICNKYRTREGEFLIEEMSCDIFIDRIGTTEIKGFKVE